MPGTEANGLVRILDSTPDDPFLDLSFPDYEDLAGVAPFLEGVAATQPFYAASVRHETETEVAFLEAVTGSYFQVLRAGVAVGRALEPGDDRAEAESVAVISHAWWQRRWGGDPGVIGETLYLNYRPFTIVGVADPAFLGAVSEYRPDAWIPIAPFRDRYVSWDRQARNRDVPLVRVFGRLDRSAGAGRAREGLARVARGLDDTYPRERFPRAFRMMPATWIDPRTEIAEERINLILRLAAGGLLLLVCANVANLLLSVFGRRRRAVALHGALGASPGALVRQAILEGLVLAGVAGAVALLVALPISARLGSYFARPSVWGANVPRQFSLDGSVVIFALGASVLAGLLAGLGPAVRAAGRGLVAELKSGPSRAVPRRILGRRAPGTRDSLVLVQVTLATVLVTVAGLVLRTLASVAAIDPGFEYERLIVSHVSTSSTSVQAEGREAWFEDLALRTAEQPWAESATVSQTAPLSPHPSASIRVDGRADPEALVVATVHLGYFEVTGIDLVRGRVFEPGDSAGAPRVAVVNQVALERFFGGDGAVGRRLWSPREDGTEEEIEVVGVVGPVKVSSFLREAEPAVYFPYRQRTYPTGSALVVRTRGDPAGAVAAMNGWLRQYEPHMAIVNVLPYAQVVRGSIYTQRMNAELFSALAALALLLSAAGIFGVVSLGVVERTREIGIRRAVGAGGGAVSGMIVREAAGPVGLGLALGVVASLGVALLLRGLLYGVRPWDPWTLAGAAVVLLLVTLSAAYVPSRRAARLDPMVALRSD
jgi:predicted permease